MEYSLLIPIVGLFISLIFLWWAGGLSVNFSIIMADIFNLNALFIGFVLISISTGLPELSIIISSVFRGVQEIPAAGILGSNICDVSLVLGLAILIYGEMKISKKESRDSLILLFITTISMAALFFVGLINWFYGIVFILIYFISIFWIWLTSTKKEMLEEEKIQEKIIGQDFSLKIAPGRGQRQMPGRVARKEKVLIVVKLLLAILLVLGASEIAVHFAIIITNKLNLSLNTIGATVFAIGSSLPEISLSLNAIKKKQYSLALGNSLGSVLEQGTFLIGILALMADRPVNIVSLRHLAPFMFFSFFIIGFSIIRRRKIGRIASLLMLLTFLSFLIYQFFWIR